MALLLFTSISRSTSAFSSPAVQKKTGVGSQGSPSAAGYDGLDDAFAAAAGVGSVALRGGICSEVPRAAASVLCRRRLPYPMYVTCWICKVRVDHVGSRQPRIATWERMARGCDRSAAGIRS